jgi:hypothetical protein
MSWRLARFHGAIKWGDANFALPQVTRLSGHTLWPPRSNCTRRALDASLCAARHEEHQEGHHTEQQKELEQQLNAL